MDAILSSHALSPALLRSDNFEAFLEDRRKQLCRLIEKAMKKPVIQISEADEYEVDDE